MDNKAVRIILTIVVALVLVCVTFAGGLLVGRSLPRQLSLPPALQILPGSGSGTVENGTPEDLSDLFKAFWQAWDLVHDQYVEQPIDDEILMRGAISGMLQALEDEHTGYMDPIQYEQANTPLSGEYDGIGAWVDTTGEYLVIVGPMEDSPAEAAGLISGDRVIAVNGKDVKGIDPSLVLRDVLGPAGTTVVLTIERGDPPEVFDVSIVRKKINVPTLEGELIEDNIGYIQIFNFGEKTDVELREKLREILDNKPIGLILDLRNNPGGYLDTAINITSQFIGDGVVMYEEYGNGERITFEARPGGLATDIPLVVLVNGGSASASEITAGAIQDLGRGVLVGENTYGKGTVQSWTELVDEQGAVKITIARWLTPSEKLITGVGLLPDIEVPFTEEDALAERDPQLDKAIEIILGGMAVVK